MSGYLHVPVVCRLVDFGSAFRADQARLVSRKGTGTVAYSAPEVINGEVRFSHPEICYYRAKMVSINDNCLVQNDNSLTSHPSHASISFPPSNPSLPSLLHSPAGPRRTSGHWAYCSSSCSRAITPSTRPTMLTTRRSDGGSATYVPSPQSPLPCAHVLHPRLLPSSIVPC